ncbi:hypothetical protein [Streptomyces sp. NBC_01428]|uniref:hypothetical protein n=1 Tax=Streptomyces sp. NBC_01428 TaxID=2903861 RepID=UPI002E362F8E|nr:hypothetical protein [Streptomyces sp. NBC_01428]
MEHPSGTVNRAALAAAGLVLLSAGIWSATAGASVADRMPGWWPRTDTDTVWVSARQVAELRDHTWWVPALVAVTAPASLLCLLWAASRISGGTRPRLTLTSRGAVLRTRALADLLTRRTSAVPGVAHSRVAVRAGRGRLYVRAHVRLAPDTAPNGVLLTLAALIEEARAAAAPCRVLTHVRISSRSHRTAHVR